MVTTVTGIPARIVGLSVIPCKKPWSRQDRLLEVFRLDGDFNRDSRQIDHGKMQFPGWVFGGLHYLQLHTKSVVTGFSDLKEILDAKITNPDRNMRIVRARFGSARKRNEDALVSIAFRLRPHPLFPPL